MKVIKMIKKYICCSLILGFISFTTIHSQELFSDYTKYSQTNTKFKLEKISVSLNHPWALTFIDLKHLLVTEKNGGLYKINVETGEKYSIKHNIQHLGYDDNSFGPSQGGFLDVYYNKKDDFIYFTYSHDFDGLTLNKFNKSSSTAIARGKLIDNEIKGLEILLIATPRQQTNVHFGSRIVIKNDLIYAGFGERGMGMIAQDPKSHPGSIIRIKTNGEIAEDNPKFQGKENWLPEIYLIGVRNPQGMAISPHDNEVYFSSHGPKGGDHIGKVTAGVNYGWKDIAWGGKEYSGFSIGDAPFKNKYEKPIKTWVPSMGISSIQFYHGKSFPEWEGDLIVCSLSGQSLIRLDYENNKIVGEEIIFKDKIGRIRDFEIDNEGNIYLISDTPNSSVWKLSI